MPEKNLFSQLDWFHVWLAITTALWGGAVSYIRRLQSGLSYTLASIASHLAVSGFAGLMCWLLCLQFDVPAPMTAICTGLAGHMGAEFIKIIEMRFANKLNEGVVNLPPIERRVADISNNPGRRATDSQSGGLE